MNINATLIGQSVAFLIFVLFCMKFVWPPVIAALHERQRRSLMVWTLPAEQLATWSWPRESGSATARSESSGS